MGGIWTRRIQLLGAISEIVGYKSGLGLTQEEYNELIPQKFHKLWFGESEALLRIRSEEFEELITYLLYKLGNIPSPNNYPFSLELFFKYKDDPKKISIYYDLMTEFLVFLKTGTEDSREKKRSLDPTPFIDYAKRKFKLDGFMMAIEILESFNLHLHRSPWGVYRQREWIDIIQLKDLFESESLETYYGKFIDQRYIDFLERNFGKIDNINWRKFEALTCEFFERQGYHVEIGEGRNDDGIDARVWNKKEDASGPPIILIQCKRQKRQIEKMVVKSLWADILEENAESGLIVTTSSLSPGAKKVCTARNYPIGEADRATLKKWLTIMRTPYTGIFMSE
ncbi:restriction endonuclease [Parageobacillus thermoglucosidasius]|uniref:Restriction endonuclease type IV Mrr domain-containing protein n=1 Tax=Parageobacillus thermoglucosidasius TaxID=1426 RepID=A0A1B7KP58_PARTM|nr:restriction endonuclease [Parageobacillus thermoglucosidasius]OAT71895.1 hypothetical protein A7K69_10820 [Parageobacillus thermoglucosidasius]